MKRVYIVPHSHWDREWYMPFEQHHMRLVELIDHLIWLFKNDPEYKFFHLDGQTVALDDYLQVRPENKLIIQQLIDEGKLQIGPFYILQDDFLTTSESNVRNMVVGKAATDQWGGKSVHVGYFPDTFGNMGQTPQLMKQAGLDVAMFGRGVKPTGFANATGDDDKRFNSTFSEMNWEGPDGTNILGILFANWYNNGAEIPTDPELARAYWDKKLASTGKFASTDDLLFLNGSDHQPVQMDLSKAIRVANQLYPDIEFIHSNYNDYLKQLKKDLPNTLDTVHGEVTSQETSGWTTLANTASNRVYVKQANTKTSKQLETLAEPLAVMAHAQADYDYPQDQLTYAWKTLMQNHPHDSICACSVDPVIDEIMTRFNKANEVGKYVTHEALDHLTAQLDTEHVEGVPVAVYNSGTSPKSGLVTADILLKKVIFNPNHAKPEDIYAELEAEPQTDYKLVDGQGQAVPMDQLGFSVEFNYDLPKDSFRKAYLGRYVKIRFAVDQMPGMSWQTLSLVPAASKSTKAAGIADHGALENEYLKVTVAADGTLDVLDKTTGEQFHHQLCFEDTGDVGNEYAYKASDDAPLLSTDFPHDVEISANTATVGELLLTNYMQVPVAMDDLLLKEQQEHLNFVDRKARRLKQTKLMKLQTTLTLARGDHQLKLKTTFDNEFKDHRLRALFATGMNPEVHYADSIFEVVKRPNQTSARWENPENPQHTHAFVDTHVAGRGLTIANIGLNEYEVARDGSQIAVTLIRCIGEMGDWGYFPTPGAQCLGVHTFNYALSPHDGSDEGFVASLHQAFALQTDLSVRTVEKHPGKIASDGEFMQLPALSSKVTAIKQAENGNGIIVRRYNLLDHAVDSTLDIAGYSATTTNLLEENSGSEAASVTLPAYGIHTTRYTQKETSDEQ